MLLEGTASYAGLLLALAEGFGLCPRLFLPFGQKKDFCAVFFCKFQAVSGVSLVTLKKSVVTLVIFEEEKNKPKLKFKTTKKT